MITTVPLFAGTATVQVTVKDAATGKTVKDAFLVVLQEADTVAAVMSSTTEPAPFQLTVPTSSVETEPRGTGLPVSSEIIATYPNPCVEKVTLNSLPAAWLELVN